MTRSRTTTGTLYTPQTEQRSAGISLIELLVAISLLGLIMGAAYKGLISQVRAYAAQTMMAETMHTARTTLDILAEQIAMAGFGVPIAIAPSVAPVLVTIEPQRLSFWANVSGARTYLRAAAAKGATSVSVLSSQGLTQGSSIYITDMKDWYFGKIVTASGTTLQITPQLSYNFTAGALVTPIRQNTFELVQGQLLRNGHVFVPDVQDLRFTYDANTPNRVTMIGVRLTLLTRAIDVSSRKKLSVTVGTQVAPPNLTL